MSLDHPANQAANLFFKNHIDSSGELLYPINGKIEVNKYFLESNELIDDHRIFIFLDTCDQALIIFKDLISRFHNSSNFLDLENKTLSNWIDVYKSEINCYNLEGCTLMFSKGVSLYRIDISPSKPLKWSNIKGETNDIPIEFGFPFSSPIDYSLPEFIPELSAKESVIILSTIYHIKNLDSLEFYEMNPFYNYGEFEEFINSKLFKEFVMYFVFNIFNKSIDILQSPALKKVFDTLMESYSKYQLLGISANLAFTSQSNLTPKKYENSILKVLIKKMGSSKETIYNFQIRMNKYFNIQDGEFILFISMEKSDESVFNSIGSEAKEELFSDMLNEANPRAIELRKSLIGDIPMNLQDRPTNLKVATNNDSESRTPNRDALELYNSGVEKLNRQDYENAIVDFRNSIDIDPYLLISYAPLSAIIINILQDYNQAIELTSKIIELEGFENNNDLIYADIYNNRGLAKSYLEEEELAIEDFNKALEIDNSRGLTYASRAFSHNNMGEAELALDDLNKAIDIDETIPNVFFSRSSCKQQLGDFRGALDDCVIALEKDPDNINIIQQNKLLEALFKSGLGDTFSNLKKD